MIRSILFSLLLVPLFLQPKTACAQVQELEQLALDIQKLAQMKSILTQMYRGYEILTSGYNTIKSIAKGNFNLHSAYLNGLLQVSPAVKSYVRVADIIASQKTLVSEYKSTLSTLTSSGKFSADELNYITSVYSNLFNRSLDNLDELVMILTDNKLRASDAERLTSIDRIYADMQDKLSFLRLFNGRAAILGAQRKQEAADLSRLQTLIGQ